MGAQRRAALRADRWDAMAQTLEDAFGRAEEHLIQETTPPAPLPFTEGCDAMFASATQAYREVALGCLLVRIHDQTRDLRLPYVSQGENAFNGRTLDERVVNPFLRGNGVPCSTGPYLNVFRRQVAFDDSTRAGVRDKAGYDGLLKVIGVVERETDDGILTDLLVYLLYRFVLLREQSRIELRRLERISLIQCEHLVDGLLRRPSGGFFPLLVVVAAMQTLSEALGLGWTVEYQGVNVADAASGAGGDIRIVHNGSEVMTVEVTERPLDADRVSATFTNKIATRGITNYVFMVHRENVEVAAQHEAERYFAQGHEVNFTDIREWIRNVLVPVGPEGRRLFQDTIVLSLSESGVKQAFKAAWNEELQKII